MKQSSKAKKVSMYGMLLALSMVLSYAEAMMPVSIGVPGVKLGLPNMVTVIGLYSVGPAGTAVISLLRILLSAAAFGNAMTLWYSAAGWALSFLCMILLRKYAGLTALSVSTAGGIMHNVGQLTAAVLLMHTAALYYYLPVLLLAGTLSGFIIGFLAGLVSERIGKYMRMFL